MVNQGIMNGEQLGTIKIVICPNCQKQAMNIAAGTICKDCSKIDYAKDEYINPIRFVELEIDIGLLFKESNELHNLKRNLK